MGTITQMQDRWFLNIICQPAIREIVDYFDLTERELGLVLYCIRQLEREFGSAGDEIFSLGTAQAILREISLSKADDFMRREWNNVLTANLRYQPFVVAFTSMCLSDDYQRLTQERQDNLWSVVFALFRLLRTKYPKPQLRLVA